MPGAVPLMFEREGGHRTLEDFRYDTQTDKVWDTVTLCDMSTKSFNLVMRHLTPPLVEASPLALLTETGRNLVVNGSTWFPGMPRLIEGYVVTKEGILFPDPGARTLNVYRAPPAFPEADAAEAGNLWVAHWRWMYPNEADFLFDYFAHIVQRPDEKSSVIVALISEQGIGKDIGLQALYRVLGPWNCAPITPDALVSEWTSYHQSVLISVDEMKVSERNARSSRVAMYEHLKAISGAQAEMILANWKYGANRYVRNISRIVVKANSIDALHIPSDDRRYFVVRSTHRKGDKGAEEPWYYRALADWTRGRDGLARVAAFLRARDLSRFDPRAEAPITSARQEVVERYDTEDDIVGEILDELDDPKSGRPGLITLLEMKEKARDIPNWMMLLEAEAKGGHFDDRMLRAGYRAFRKSEGWQVKKDGKKLGKVRVVYYRTEQPPSIEVAAAHVRRVLLAKAARDAEKNFSPVGPEL